MPNLADTASRLEGILVERLIAWATSNWPSEQAYALGLVFTIGHSPLPAPGIGTVEEQEAWLDDQDEYGAGLMIWNPAEYEAYNPDFTEDELQPDAPNGRTKSSPSSVSTLTAVTPWQYTSSELR